jgi:hypothetical protein
LPPVQESRATNGSPNFTSKASALLAPSNLPVKAGDRNTSMIGTKSRH